MSSPHPHAWQGLCLTSVIALLLAVMTSPIRPASPPGPSAPANGLHRNSTLGRNFALARTSKTRQASSAPRTSHALLKSMLTRQEEGEEKFARPADAGHPPRGLLATAHFHPAGPARPRLGPTASLRLRC